MDGTRRQHRQGNETHPTGTSTDRQMADWIIKIAAVGLGILIVLAIWGCDNPVAPENDFCAEVKVEGVWQCLN